MKSTKDFNAAVKVSAESVMLSVVRRELTQEFRVALDAQLSGQDM